MTNSKHSRHTPSPSSPPTQHASKLPRFLQKQAMRDRSKSMSADPTGGGASTSSLASGSSASTSSDIPSTPSTSKGPRKSSKFLALGREKDDISKRSSDILPGPTTTAATTTTTTNEMDEAPVIVEPVNIPRPRTRSERPLSTDSHQQHLSLYSSTSSTSRIGDLPTRLSGWFSHTFSTSSTDLSLPTILTHSASTSSASPRGKSTPASALLTAAKHGKGHLDKAVRYLLDSDSTPDKCTDPIWLLGVQHPGYEPPPPPQPVDLSASTSSSRRNSGSFRSSTSSSFRSSTISAISTAEQHQLSQSQSSSRTLNPAANWPPVFYADFTSRVWLTYRSQFTPIRDTRLADLPAPGLGAAYVAEAVAASPTTVKTRPWNWGGEKGWTSDSGWGCMLRTGQSLLANALVNLYLGRDWRRPPYPVHTADYATYVQILTWFFDTPSPEAPFSVHRMALAGKELGKDVGQWFGPSTAAGAIKSLVNGFPEAGLGVAVATDGVLFQTEIFTASHGNGNSRSPRRQAKLSWGDRPVLVLIGVRLGIEGVNPIYYDTIKLLYTFPQSVGIAGGRPSSSYYFVGSQADNLFYLDPHHARPAIPVRPAPPAPTPNLTPYYSSQRETTPESDREGPKPKTQRSPTQHYHRVPTSPSSTRTGSSTFSYHAPISPSPLQQEFSTSTTSSAVTALTTASSGAVAASEESSSHHNDSGHRVRGSRSPSSPMQQRDLAWQPPSQPGSPSSEMDHRELTGFGNPGLASGSSGLDILQEHYVTAYNAMDLKTFHCERVRKMPLSGLDPSMLIGFLCKDEADWWDFRRRVGELPKTVFSVQDEPPTWPSDSDDNMGLESISEPDDMDMDMDMDDDEEEEEDEAEQFFDTRSSGSPSTSSASASGGHRESSERGKSEDIDTEEDPVDPITPGPNSRFSIENPPGQRSKGGVSAPAKEAEFDLGGEEEDRFEEGDIEDDWVDPSIPTPSSPSGGSREPPIPAKDPPQQPSASPAEPVQAKGSKKGRKGKKGGQIPVPVPLVRIPTPGSGKHVQEHFPFPVTQRSAEETSPTRQGDRSRNSSNKGTGGKRMHTARARDGGRTQSGGVKGILTDD